ncbi:hypothetical protein WJX81_004361 [Elliptochloris bilobata]|uniref:RBR-type E3 ubiquitin transferase n=1 Tax=Elliptochloris bilobata TaxID=381761 RepID=A0AAW1SHD1_9CHLO
MPERDCRLQVEEALALQAILGPDFEALGEGEVTAEAGEALLARGPPAGGARWRIKVRVELPVDGLALQVGRGSTIAAAAASAPLTVKHLPPLRLDLACPAGYPATDPPRATLAAPWLGAAQAAALQAALAAFADLAQGEGAEDVLLALLRYSAAREYQLWQEGMWTCGVCLEEVAGAQCLRPAECAHFFCRGCVRGQAAVHVAEGALDALRCPNPQCRAPFLRERVAGLLGPEAAERWERLELDQGLARMPDVVHCPHCSTPTIEDGGSDNCAQCPKCLFAFCTLCNESWHGRSTQCVSAELKLALLRQRMTGVRDKSQMAELRKREQEYCSLAHIKGISKQCPSCGMAIQKMEGCNKVTCSCGTFFCWKCNRAIAGYSHFRDGDCLLFDDGELARQAALWNVQFARMMAEARNNAQREVLGNDARIAACPACGQHNAKADNNNHMRCWACNAYFCYLCRKLLRGAKAGAGGRHFSHKGCRQHSSD